ncbi:hypothetical protein DL763_006269 [Monosporascus cannonballus]|nr:hypothetical protein DL763_006269 [Monosporascus cannonballus]
MPSSYIRSLVRFLFSIALIGAVVTPFASATSWAPLESPSAERELICHTDNPAECYPKIFSPTDEFQIVHDDQDLPPGLHVQLDIQTGQKRARLNTPTEENPALQGLPVDRSVVVIDSESPPDTPRIPPGAPEYDLVGKVKEPQEKNEGFFRALETVKSHARNGEYVQSVQLSHALDELEELSHDIYYGLQIAEDTEVLQGLLCILTNRDKEQALAKPLTERSDFLASSIISSAVRNNRPALRAVEESWANIMQNHCIKFVTLYSYEMAATDRKGWATSEDWARHRQLITALYCDENRTLKEVMEIMRGEHNFVATVKMYKFRFAVWGVQKNLKHRQVAELLAQQNRGHVDGQFPRTVIGGREVDENRIASYLSRVSPAKRKKIEAIVARSNPKATAENPAPLDMARRAPLPVRSAKGPSPAHFKAPDSLKLPEECARILHDWVHGAFEAGQWSTRKDGRLVIPRHQSRWIFQVSTAVDLIDRGLVNPGFRLLGVCLDQYKQKMLQGGPMLFLNTYRAGVRLAARAPDLSLFNSFLRFAYELAGVIFTPSHPLRLLLQRFQVTGARLQQLAWLLLDVYLASVGSHVNPNDSFLVVQKVAFLGKFDREGSGSVAAAVDRGLRDLRELEEQGKSQADVVHPVKLSLAEALYGSRRYAEAKQLAMEVLATASGGGGCGHRRVSVYDFLLRDLLREGRHAEAANLAEEALRFCAAHLGPDHWRTAHTKVSLSFCLDRSGDPDAARRVLEDFDSQWEIVCRRPAAYSCSCGHRDEEASAPDPKSKPSAAAEVLLPLSGGRPLELRLAEASPRMIASRNHLSSSERRTVVFDR